MRHLAMLAAAAVALAALAACDGMVVVYQPIHAQNYVSGDFETAARPGEVAAVIFANAPAMDRARLEELVTGYMNKGVITANARFSTRPGDRANKDYKVVLMLNGPISVGGADLCAQHAAFETAPVGTDLRVSAAFCYRGIVLSEAEGSTDGLRDLTDRRAGTLIARVVAALQPAIDYWDIGDDGAGPFL